jgi:hypothetical protein
LGRGGEEGKRRRRGEGRGDEREKPDLDRSKTDRKTAVF